MAKLILCAWEFSHAEPSLSKTCALSLRDQAVTWTSLSLYFLLFLNRPVVVESTGQESDQCSSVMRLLEQDIASDVSQRAGIASAASNHLLRTPQCHYR